MRLKIDPSKVGGEIVQKIEEVSGESVYRCYQCGKCSAACPAAPEMDMLPNQVIRHLQLGLDKEVLAANTPWICAACLQCMTVCPKGVDLAKIMEAVRSIHLRAGQNEVDVSRFDPEYRKRAPPIALISAYRKFLSLS